MAKRVKSSELENLIKESFEEAYKMQKLSDKDITVSVFINSIFAKVSFTFNNDTYDSISVSNKISDNFANILKKYVGDNLKTKTESALSKNSTSNIFIQIDYDIVE